MDVITGKTIQTYKGDMYISGPCQCGTCSTETPYQSCKKHNNIRDWSIGGVKCCGGFCRWQSECVPLEKKVQCQIGNSSKGKDPFIDIAWDKIAPNVKCTYDASYVDTVDQVNNFIDKFGETDELMTHYCGRKVTKCPGAQTACSRIKSTAPGARLCREWYAKQSPTRKDDLMKNYCANNRTDDCKCVNRADDPIYNKLKMVKINDGCWYIPCANPSKYFVPSKLVNAKCPDSICDIIFEYIKDKKIDIDYVKNKINCDFNPTPSYPQWPVIVVTAVLFVLLYIFFKGTNE